MALDHQQAGRLEEAEQLYRQVLAREPRHPDGLHLLGGVVGEAGRFDEAIELILRAIMIAPKSALYHTNLAGMFFLAGRLDAAVACGGRALELDPESPQAHRNLGLALARRKEPEAALAAFRRAAELAPGEADGHVRAGDLLVHLDRPDEAAVCYRRALALKPDLPEALLNLGWTRLRQMRLAEAMEIHERVIALAPDSAQAHVNLAMVLLARGEMPRGWAEFEWRWRVEPLNQDPRQFTQPRWNGEPAPGATLLIHAEQGLGDALQFCRLATQAAARGLRVVMEAQQPVTRLLRGLAGVEQVMARGEPLPHFDLQCPMMSLPLILGMTVETVPAPTGYLRADPAAVSTWSERLAAVPVGGLRVGVAWAGAAWLDFPMVASVNRRRSIEPERLGPLFAVEGATFFSLQKDGPAAPASFPLVDLMSEMADFADTAALVANLDLVIAVDTAVAHLAGALGKPVWLLDRFDCCWRWLQGRTDSPWYPTMRIYRQPRAGDWEAVVVAAAGDLATLVAGSGG